MAEQVNSQSSQSQSSAGSSQSESSAADTFLTFEPAIIKGKGGERMWKVENVRECIDICRTQLKVHLRTQMKLMSRMSLHISSSLSRQRKGQSVGTMSTKRLTPKQVLLTSYVRDASGSNGIPITIQTELRPIWLSTWAVVSKQNVLERRLRLIAQIPSIHSIPVNSLDCPVRV